MTDEERAYSDELALALRSHDLSSRQIGEVLTEVEAHVAETDEKPAEAFGAPRDYAAHAAAHLGRNGKGRSTAAVVGAGSAVGACALIGARLLIDGTMANERTVTFTVAHGASLLALLAVITTSAYFLVRAVAAGAGRVVLGTAGACVALALVGVIVLSEWFPGDGARLLALPSWAAITLGGALLVTMAALLGLLARRGRIVGPWG